MPLIECSFSRREPTGTRAEYEQEPCPWASHFFHPYAVRLLCHLLREGPQGVRVISQVGNQQLWVDRHVVVDQHVAENDSVK